MEVLVVIGFGVLVLALLAGSVSDRRPPQVVVVMQDTEPWRGGCGPLLTGAVILGILILLVNAAG